MSAGGLAAPARGTSAVASERDTLDGWTALRRVRLRPTRRAGMHVVLGLLLYGAGANVAAGWVVALSAFTLGALPWAWLTARRVSGTVAARRTVPEEATAGAPVDIELEVRAATTAVAVVHDALTAAIGAVGDLRDGARLHTRAPLPRGIVTDGEVEVVVTDLFGLFRATCRGSVPAATTAGRPAVVQPAIPRVARGSFAAMTASDHDGDVGRRGAGPDVIGVREFTHGDPLRAVHWRSSARHSRLVVRELAETALPRVRVELARGPWEQAALDRAVEAMCGVAADASDRGYAVQVAADGAALSWGRSARRHLATVPPHAGAAARALAPAPETDADVTLVLAPSTGGVVATIDGADSGLGVLDPTADLDAVGAWLSRAGVRP